MLLGYFHQMESSFEIPAKIAVSMVPFLLALTFHEFAHGLVAKWLGDNTAERSGRLTLNPISHMDVIGTLVFPIVGILSGIPVIGWAKPVPVNERNLRNPLKDMFWIALAGPLSNVLMATIAIFVLVPLNVFHLAGEYSRSAEVVVGAFVFVNLYLAVFNMIPVNPLDGGKVIARFLPPRWNDYLEENQTTINLLLLALFFTGGLAFLRYPVQWLYSMLLTLAQGTYSVLLT